MEGEPEVHEDHYETMASGHGRMDALGDSQQPWFPVQDQSNPHFSGCKRAMSRGLAAERGKVNFLHKCSP